MICTPCTVAADLRDGRPLNDTQLKALDVRGLVVTGDRANALEAAEAMDAYCRGGTWCDSQHGDVGPSHGTRATALQRNAHPTPCGSAQCRVCYP